MFDDFLNMFRIVGEDVVTQNPSSSLNKKEEERIPVKFSRDIEALKNQGFKFRSGKIIEIDLKTALLIMPRDRKRCDGYNSLIKYLQDNYGVRLVINSRKRKEDYNGKRKEDKE